MSLVLNSLTNDIMVTANIHALNKKNEPVRCRGLLDTCSTTNLITENLAKILNLRRSTCHIPIGALNNMTTYSEQIMEVVIKSPINNFQKTITYLIVPTIAQAVPNEPIDRNSFKLPKNIKLADPTFHIPAPVDILLGAGTTLSLLCVGQIRLASSKREEIYLQKTLLGWIIGGSVPTTQSNIHHTCHVTDAIHFQLSKFWELEECTDNDHLYTYDENACEEHFTKHVTRNNQGRYVVALPFKPNHQKLGSSYESALNRFKATERRLNQNIDLKNEYHRVLNEYIELQHMSPISNQLANSGRYYLPHHAVIKESSTTTKVRVVFDGSAKTTTGVSLNDVLFAGPTIQTDLFSLLLRFRKHPIVLTAPYLAIRCLHQLANDEGDKYPKAASILKEDFYVDDVLTGANNLTEAIKVRQELTEILKSAGLKIRQWASNEHKLLVDIPAENINTHLQLGDTSTLKTLGIYWNSTSDSISYKVKPFHNTSLLAPVVIIAKIMLQKLWALRIDWDESLSMDLHTEWITYSKQLQFINEISFPRTIVTPAMSNIQLHGFSDASNKAYGACVYLRVVDCTGKIESQILCAKSRVAPLKQSTIPRLELCGAELLSILMKTTVDAIKLQIDQVYYWTDSTIVLQWINTGPERLKVFVANRIAHILENSNKESWHHVPTEDNPADIVSRGKSPREFIQSMLWRKGPHWLIKAKDEWPQLPLVYKQPVPEQRKLICLMSSSIKCDFLYRFSSIEKLTRVMAYCLRFLDRGKVTGPLSIKELHNSLQRIIKLVQKETFSNEVYLIKQQKQLNSNQRQLIKLHPFVDQVGLIRVGGRLTHSDLSYEERHPIVLPKAHHVTKLIIIHEHKLHLHAGVHSTLYAVRRKYWPIDGKAQVWKILKGSIQCAKTKSVPAKYLMGSLPRARVTPSRPFSQVGVDYCGPFHLKEKKFRNQKTIKAYVAVFVCLAIKAVHLELVTDLTTEGFISTFRRFIARRGACQNIYSDNDTNFVGSNNMLKELFNALKDQQEKIQDYLSTKQIQWHFIPPQAPHVGGLWEAAVKSFKKHLHHVAGQKTLFTYEQFYTLIVEIEAILNSRPLTPISSDPSDPLVLTPGHFLIGDSMTNLQEYDYLENQPNHLSTWQHIQYVKQHFWRRWSREYLNELTIRQKWNKTIPNLDVGTIVLIKEDNLPPARWAMGKILECYPSDDGVVRRALVKTATTTILRNLKKLIILPVKTIIEENSES